MPKTISQRVRGRYDLAEVTRRIFTSAGGLMRRPLLAATLVVTTLACNTHKEPQPAPRTPSSADHSDPAKALEYYQALREGTAVVIELPASDEVRQSRGPPRVYPERLADAALRFDVEPADVEVLRWDEAHDAVYMQLNRGATSALKSVTAGNVGRTIVVYVGGIAAVRTTVVGSIDSGIITIRSPAPPLLTKLREIDTAVRRRK